MTVTLDLLANICSTTLSRHMSHIIFSRKIIALSSWSIIVNSFRKIPFYHAREATQAIRPVLGTEYHKDDTNIMLALWSTFRKCRVMEEVISKDGSGLVRVWVK